MKRIINCVLAILLSLVLVFLWFPPVQARAIAGIDDAILFGFLATLIGTAAGVTVTAAVNGSAVNSNNPMTADDIALLFAPTGSAGAVSGTGTDVFFNAVKDRVANQYNATVNTLSDFFDWVNTTLDPVNESLSFLDGLFVADVHGGSISANVPDFLADIFSGAWQDVLQALGATSATSVDWDDSVGNFFNATVLGGDFSDFFFTSTALTWGPNSSGQTYSLSSSDSDVFYGFVLTDSTHFMPVALCDHSFSVQYGYYDRSGGWHASSTTIRSSASGWSYFLPSGAPSISTFQSFSSPLVGSRDDLLTVLGGSSVVSEPEEMTYTVLPGEGVEEMLYPVDPTTGTKNVETVPYYVDGQLLEGVEAIPYYTDMPLTGVLNPPLVDGEAIPFADAIPAVQEGVLSGELEGSYERIENDNPPAGDGDIPLAGIGLDDIFPFCIPFDIFHFFEALAADPVAPHFEWRMNVPGIVDYTFVIDLSEFNTVAQIFRTLELLLFCVGLALVTRNLIRG